MIGNGAVVQAESVVTENVPAYAIVGENPARVVKYRFDEAMREALQRIKWWNWSEEKIQEKLPLLLGAPQHFVTHFVVPEEAHAVGDATFGMIGHNTNGDIIFFIMREKPSRPISAVEDLHTGTYGIIHA